MITLEELKIFLIENVPEVELMELLQLNSETLVRTFSDTVEDKFDFICHKYGIQDEIPESEE
jgi:hypothetical protein